MVTDMRPGSIQGGEGEIWGDGEEQDILHNLPCIISE